MSNVDKEFPAEVLRATGLRVEHRGGRLIVRTGPPRLLVGVGVAGVPAMVLLTTLLRSRRWEAAAPDLILSVVIAAGAWLGVGTWTLTLDRQKGTAGLCRGPWRTRHPLAAIVGVRLFSMRQAQIERVRRRRTVMPYAPVADKACGVALVDTAGRRWRVTRSQDRSGYSPRREDAEQAARLVANYLGIPFLPPYETPPGGAIPPPLEECALPQQHR